MATIQAAPDEVARVLQQMDREFERNVLAKDADALVSGFYAEDAQVFPPNQPVVEGHEAIRQLWGGFIPLLSRFALNTTRIEASGDLAVGSGTYQMRLTPPEGDPIEDNGKYVVVYRRQPDGGYKVVADIFNSSRPA